jgi:hypothetical protein
VSAGDPPQDRAVLPRAVLLRMAVLAGVWAGLTGLLIAAGELVVHSAAIAHFDDHVTRVVVSARTTPLNSAMKAVTWLGSWVALLVTALIIAGLVISRRLQVLALIVAVFAWAGGSGGVTIAKHVVGRERLTAIAISLGGRLRSPEPAGPEAAGPEAASPQAASPQAVGSEPVGSEPAGQVSSQPRRWPRRAGRAGSA